MILLPFDPPDVEPRDSLEAALALCELGKLPPEFEPVAELLTWRGTAALFPFIAVLKLSDEIRDDDDGCPLILSEDPAENSGGRR